MDWISITFIWLSLSPIGGKVDGCLADYQRTRIAVVSFKSADTDEGWKDLVAVHMCSNVEVKRPSANLPNKARNAYAYVIWPRGSNPYDMRSFLVVLSHRPLIKQVIVGHPTSRIKPP